MRWLAVAALTALGVAPAHAAGQSGTSVSGQVVDRGSGAPLADVAVTLGGMGSVATDERGLFRFERVPLGWRTLRVEHVAYGAHEEQVEVGAEPLRLTIEVDPEEIRLAPLLVEAMSRGERERRGAGRQLNVITRDQIRRYEDTAMTLVELLSALVPGVHITRSGVVGSPTCLEFRGARTGNFVRGLGSSDPGCNSPEVYLDGALVPSPSTLYATLPIETIQSIDVVQPSEAGARFGTGSLWGALIIDTMRPGRSPDPRAAAYLRGPERHNWALEASGHRTGRVFAAAAAGNAAGLLAGVALAGRCIGFRGANRDAITTTCDAKSTMAAGVAAVALPALGSALGARLAGRTERSRGTLGAALVGAAVTLIPGYALGVAGQRGESGVMEKVGVVTLTVAVPLVATLTDRLFRAVTDEG